MHAPLASPRKSLGCLTAMNAMKNAFADTNILVYAAGGAAGDLRKKQIAREILLLPHLHISVQVLNEFIVCGRNPKKLNLTRNEEGNWLREWLDLKVCAIHLYTFEKALELHLRFQLSHWDSLIIASALESACSIVYSEDMGHGQKYDAVTVINPFV